MADYTQLQPLRAALRQTLDSQSLLPGRELDEVAERMAIVATELATNALRHGQSRAVVQLRRSATAFVLDVADESPSAAPQIIEGRSPSAGGRGLHITRQLALEAGWYVTDGTKHVWAQFAIPRRVRRFQAPRISIFGLKTFVRLLRRLRM